MTQYELQVYQIELEMQNEELRRTHTELEALRERYFDLYNLAPVGYVTLGAPGLVEEANLTAATLLGAGHPARLVRQPFRRFALKEDAGVYDLFLARLSADGGPQACDVRMTKEDGTVFWAHLHATAAAETGGRPACRIALSDITGRKAAERALARLNAELEQRDEARTAELVATNLEFEAFCYSVFHDLRAPLRSMDGFSRALLEDYGPLLDAAGKDFLQRVRSNSQRMARLLDDLLNLDRLKQAYVRHSDVDLTALAESTVAELRKAEPSRAVAVRIGPSLTAKGDSVLLGTALANLLENAWKFTRRRPDAAIEFGAEPRPAPSDGTPSERDAAPPQPVFFVRDNGVGFDMHYADKLSTPFQRLHEITEFPGIGIGLATVQRVIHRHSGRVWCDSAPGKGATFYFTVGANAGGSRRPAASPL